MYSNKLPNEVSDWVSSIGRSTPAQMARKYSRNSVLLATYENLLIGRDDIQGYFESFLDKENLKCQVVNNVTQIGGSEQIASGIYLFSFTENGKKQVVEARYSFVVKGGLVINHHSSETPE
jgi:hypothetical protein